MLKSLRNVVLVAAVISVPFLSACAGTPKPDIKAVQSTIDVACVITNALLPNDVVHKVCSVAPDVVSLVDQILASHRTALAKAAPSGAAPCTASSGK